MNRIMIGVAILLFVLTVMPSSSHAGVTIIIPDHYPTVQQGIDAAVGGDTVLVRNGIYLLSASLDFKGKAITVISENGAGSCILDAQSKASVVYFHSGEGNDSVLSGFTIRNGNALYGGGIRLDSSSPTITECNISANLAYESPGDYYAATAYGGGIYSNGSSPKITACKIIGNQATTGGGAYVDALSLGAGIYISGGSPKISDCIIDGNVAGSSRKSRGGGIYSAGASPSLTNTIVSNNSSTKGPISSQGGGIYFAGGSPLMINCIVSGNSAKLGGGVYFEESSAFSDLTNCTIVRNTATTNGGGLYSKNTSPRIINSILWEDSPEEVYNEGTSNPTITYSDVLGGYAGTGNINASPLFVNTSQEDYHLTLNSPCLNVGSNAAPELPLQDKDGNARINNFVVDMGAYEYSSTILLLNNNRFRVQVDWHIPSGIIGQGTAVPLTSDSGYFWFFNGSNVELLIKILDGRGVNNHYWFFWGAMTDVQYTITVTDTQTGAVKTYQGVQGVQKSGNDINAF